MNTITFRMKLLVMSVAVGLLFCTSPVMAAKPSLASLDADPPIPADNPMSDAKVALGKLLFFDPRLGGDASVNILILAKFVNFSTSGR